jgi:alpha-tubulin suppressor-like RCC1 family protein
MALTESGCVYIWGDNRCGQLGIENIKKFEWTETTRIERYFHR